VVILGASPPPPYLAEGFVKSVQGKLFYEQIKDSKILVTHPRKSKILSLGDQLPTFAELGGDEHWAGRSSAPATLFRRIHN
jgi:hypothetical protein